MSTPLRTRQTLMTAEEFAQLPDDGKRYELVRGVVLEMSHPSREHGEVAVRVAVLIGRWNDVGRTGRVRVESGFVLQRGPDTVRGPDISFVRRDRDGDVDGPWVKHGPDLAVEIRSPGDRKGEIEDRVADYLRAGTALVWIVDPAKRTVTVRRPGARDEVLRGDDEVGGRDVLPGFATTVREMFADLA